MAKIRKLKKRERRALLEARELIPIAADEMGVRKRRYLRLLRRKDPEAVEVFREVGAIAGIDPDRLSEILEMLIEILKKFLELWLLF